MLDQRACFTLFLWDFSYFLLKVKLRLVFQKISSLDSVDLVLGIEINAVPVLGLAAVEHLWSGCLFSTWSVLQKDFCNSWLDLAKILNSLISLFLVELSALSDVFKQRILRRGRQVDQLGASDSVQIRDVGWLTEHTRQHMVLWHDVTAVFLIYFNTVRVKTKNFIHILVDSGARLDPAVYVLRWFRLFALWTCLVEPLFVLNGAILLIMVIGRHEMSSRLVLPIRLWLVIVLLKLIRLICCYFSQLNHRVSCTVQSPVFDVNSVDSLLDVKSGVIRKNILDLETA